MFSYYSVSALANIVANVGMGSIVFAQNRKNRQNLLFSLFCAAVALWSAFYFLWQIANNADTALKMCRGLMLGAIWIPVFFFHYTLLLVRRARQHRILLAASYGVAMAISIADLCGPLVVEKVEPRLSFLFWPVPGDLFHVHLAMFTILVLWAIWLLVQGVRSEKGVLQAQLRYALLATIGGFGGGMTNYFLWYGIPLRPVATVSVSFYTLVIAFAILRHHFMDIRLVVRDTTLHSITALLLAASCMVVGLPLVAMNPYLAVIASVAAMGFLMAFAYEPIRRALQPAIDRVVFANRFTYLEELAQLPNDMLEFTNLGEMLEFLVVRLRDAARLTLVRVFMYDPGHQSYLETHGGTASPSTQASAENEAELSADGPLIALLKGHPRLWSTPELSARHDDASTQALSELTQMKGVACFPVKGNDDLLGLVILGPKKTGEVFNQTDLRILRSLQGRLENFLAQAMVITQEAMNMVKDSHDMKNDINALKGRVAWRSMRGSAWWIDFENQLKTMDEILTKAALSEEDHRLLAQATQSIRAQTQVWYDDTRNSFPIEDGALKRLAHRLKNWAEYGRVVSEGFRGSRQMQAVDVSEAASLSVERWRPMAERKGLMIAAFAQPGFHIWGERTLLEQIIENLIDNAVKSTTNGEVKVVCTATATEVGIEVKDSGCGIPEEHLSTIFSKPFYQGRGRDNLEQSTGVGLYLVSQYAKSLGGRVEAESKVDRGSTFRVILPLHQPNKAGAAA